MRFLLIWLRMHLLSLFRNKPLVSFQPKISKNLQSLSSLSSVNSICSKNMTSLISFLSLSMILMTMSNSESSLSFRKSSCEMIPYWICRGTFKNSDRSRSSKWLLTIDIKLQMSKFYFQCWKVEAALNVLQVQINIRFTIFWMEKIVYFDM